MDETRTVGRSQVSPKAPSDRKPSFDIKMWRRIFHYLMPGWRELVVVVFCIIVISILNVVPGLLIKILIDSAIPDRNLPLLFALVVGMIAGPLIGNLLGVWQNSISLKLGQNVVFDLRNEMHEHLLKQSLRFYTRTKSGEIISRIQNDVGGVQAVVSNTVVNLLSNVLTIAVIAIVIVKLDWILALVALTILPIFVLPTTYVGRMRGQLAKQTQESLAIFSAYVSERLSIGGYLLTRLFGAQKAEREGFRERSETIRHLMIRQGSAGRWFLMFIMSFASVGPALIYLVGGSEAISGRLTIGTVVAFVGFLGRLYAPASALVNTQVELITASALFRRIFEYLDLAPEIANPSNPRAMPTAPSALRFEEASFSYDADPTRLTTKGLSFEVPFGKMVAVVGPSGAGKTTVAYLAARLYDPTAGRITFGGVDLREFDLGDLARTTAFVTQEPNFFNTTILENIRYAKPAATLEEVERACELVSIHNVVSALPSGLMTVIGERGYKLSGGEKQRLGLARVALRDPKLVILDEATSALDSRSEAEVNLALQEVLRGRSSLVIAHRLSTVMRADTILVMDKGAVVERGTHFELLAAGGLYEKLYREQFAIADQPGEPAG